MPTTLERGPLLIADISGYTHYMASIDLDGSHVVSELLDTIATALHPFEVVKLEGDAVFCRAAAGEVGRDETLALIACAYEEFVAHADRITNEGGCGCQACHLLPGLGLKFVVHHGEYAVHRIAGYPELVGAEVILVHRLLKNTVGTEWGRRDYVLLTRQWADDTGLDPASLRAEAHSEAYEHIGNVDCLVLELGDTADRAVARDVPRVALEVTSCSYQPEEGSSDEQLHP